MLKRNGESCQHEVPGYPGMLTTTEFQAYREAFAVVEDQICALTEADRALAKIEKLLPQIPAPLTSKILEPAQSLEAEELRDSGWQVRRTLHKSARNELLLCSRDAENGREFAVIERFDPSSPYAKANGSCEVQLVSNDPRLLLQDYVEQEKQLFRLFRSDLVAQVEEVLSQKFPDQNMSRVTKAIAARCNSAGGVDQPQEHSQTTAAGVKVRM
jgi:hypothetical protein